MSEQFDRDRLYVDGSWVEPLGGGRIEVVDPTSEQVIGHIPEGVPDDVDRAVRAAATAAADWAGQAPADRAKYCSAVADALRDRQGELADLIAHELGMPLKLATAIQTGLPIATFASMAEVVAETTFEERVANSLVVREPVGVVGAITPWNYPLHQIAAKVAPALTAGCPVILKPSEVTPLNAFFLADVIDGVGLPAGVFNLVSGYGPVVGEALAAHPMVDMVSFTGSTRAGRRVSEVAAATVKQTALELGGKSPNVLLDDLSGDALAKAVSAGVAACFLNSGQTCSALTRMIVPRSQLAEVEELAKAAAERFTPGDPFDPATRLGPLVSETQRERVRGYISAGAEEGARLVTGGAEAPESLEHGYFVRPTVFSDVTRDMTIAQEEIFGPVLVLMPYDDEEEALRIANDSSYGLAGGVWSADPDRATQVARRIRTGQVEINGGKFNPLAPFGGFKQSGHGREYGKFGLAEFLTTKSMQL